MAEYNVVEKFISINGEGMKAGQLAVFIRFKGCNLQCSYCDTAWANNGSVSCTKYTEEQLYRYVKESGVANVTLTGGEPLIQEGLAELLYRFSQDPSIYVEIETNGSEPIESIRHIPSPLTITMDYKLPSSRMESRMNHDNFVLLRKKDTVKFVVGSMEDMERAKQIIETYSLTERCNVIYSPVYGRIQPVEIVEYMKENCLNGVKLQLQLHKFIWSAQERGV